ncbi:MAG TPA: reverse transcriptase family protein [Candidatus Saccharimonadales bacterium]|nr:reverse transcriptase family protein [Candidatus Saccharimonadales bacterium]
MEFTGGTIVSGIGSRFATIEALCKELEINPADFQGCALNREHHVKYRPEEKPDGSLRDIYAPSEKLKEIQRKIKDIILATFDYPEYVYGLGGNTLRHHAEVHNTDGHLVKVDIRNFFPSIHHSKVYKMWVELFGFNPQIASFLTKLTTHRGCLQQGFPTSSHIAAIVSIPITKELQAYSHANQINFSQYVDDLNFSGETIIYKDMFKLVVSAVRRHGFSIKPRKTKVYNKKTAKLITGVSVTGGRMRAPRQVRKRAIDALKAYSANPQDLQNQKRVHGYAGFLEHLNHKDGQKYHQKIKRISSDQ